MPRVARIVVPHVAHHITQRGNNRQDVFFLDDDRRVYLELLQKNSQKYGLCLLGYCLMTNHIYVSSNDKDHANAKLTITKDILTIRPSIEHQASSIKHRESTIYNQESVSIREIRGSSQPIHQSTNQLSPPAF